MAFQYSIEVSLHHLSSFSISVWASFAGKPNIVLNFKAQCRDFRCNLDITSSFTVFHPHLVHAHLVLLVVYGDQKKPVIVVQQSILPIFEFVRHLKDRIQAIIRKFRKNAFAKRHPQNLDLIIVCQKKDIQALHSNFLF